MTKFWDTEEGKILSHGIHEHSSGLGMIINELNYIELLTKKEKITKNDYEISFNRIKDGRNKCKEAMDYIYNKFKEKYENNI